MSRTRIAVFASGSGSNLAALLEHLERIGDSRASDLAIVVSDRPGARALERARARKIETAVLENPSSGEEICGLLSAHGIGMVVLAGYLRLLPAAVVAAYPRRVLNIHPAPLPQFGGRGMYGRKVHEAVLAAGVASTAVSIHFVDEEYDRGAVIAQWPVEIRTDDTPESLSQRVLAAEHVVYPRIIEMVAALISDNS